MTTNQARAATPVSTARAVAVLTLRDRRVWMLLACVVAIAAGAQAIGPVVIPLGIASITLLPMIWGILAGTIVSGQRLKPFPIDLQQAATVVMGVAVLFLVARMSFTIGPNIPLLLQAGPALLLQELGHLFGTIALALPLAVLLRMGPATVGATFSIDREGSFAMVSERYGSDSPQYRGVLSMYVFGTIFGAVIVSLIASLAASLGLFDPLALAMGAGVGSGSMMAAAASVIVSAHPEMQDQVLALAATSNLITGILGLYIGVWVSLPLADRLYKALTRDKDALLPGRRPRSPQGTLPAADLPTIEAATVHPPTVRVPLWLSVLIISAAGLVVAAIAARSLSVNTVITYAMLTILVLAGLGAARITRGKVPAIIVVMTAGALLTSPLSPIASWVTGAAASVDFLALITVMLTIAGLSLGKDLPMLRSIGWKIIPVGIVSITASFLLSAVVAEFALGLWGH
ncbi:DUF3100 domain-containing protein [Microbacterium hominis]|uniref:DUF3100 domain-containing protein n=1 Tax=Microbacterium TaxID=33882 RepID=UPI00168B2744|nr:MULTISPECIES: DUF3100 domain-containing protein [Microbacterium]QOC26498.1 DUF3100 domain-containing protein [Microbacterium hominis]QOC27673.1 DUF3100 domain-containing protein [Microbacterium hominis]QYF97194.1 DUF3100 domain-containing protein [Microbacterium sp. PAMC21962]